MARLMAVANGNNTSASTWALIDSSSFAESEASANVVPTAYSTGLAQFTPGAITVDGIGLRFAARTGTTGTFSTELYNHTAAASVAGTEVTINCSDFVDATSTDIDGGWYFFKFSAPVLLLAANNYSIRYKTSNATQISLYGANVTTPAKFLRTTTTQAPVAGDDRFVMGEWTAAATTTTRTVTLDDTSATDYGSGSTGLSTPALSISAGGIVLAGTSASTTYTQKISGNIVVYNGGILRLATSGSRMPSTSSFTLTLDCSTTLDFGIDVRRKGEFTAYGESKQRWTLLTSDEAATSTSIQVVSTSGWKNNDTLFFPSTSATSTAGETKTISTVDSATQVTLSAGLSAAHSGTGDVVGEVANINSNVKIVGTSATVATFICFKASSIGYLDNVEVEYFGSSTSNKRGVEFQHLDTSTNSVTLNSCIFKNPATTSGLVGNALNNGAFFTVTNNVLCSTTGGTAGAGFAISGGNSGTPTFTVTGNLVAGSSAGVNFGTGYAINAWTGASGIISDNRAAGCSTGVTAAPTFSVSAVQTFTNFTIHSCATGMSFSGGINRTITGANIVSCANGISSLVGVNIFNSCLIAGNTTAGIAMPTSGVHADFNSCTIRGRSGVGQPSGLLIANAAATTGIINFNSCAFGSTVAHTTSDITVSGVGLGLQVTLNNCALDSTTEITSTAYANLDDRSYVAIQRKDTSTGNHCLYVRQAIITPDTTIYRTSSPSLRIAPKSASVTASNKLATFKVPINSGETCTPSLYVRESVVGDGTDYNGNFAKLYVKTNYNLGITSDTLLDTATAASTGGWELLTGTTAAVTDNGVLEFYIVVDGTTGWVNIDDFSFVNA